MNEFHRKYQEIILRDVRSPDYLKQKKWVWFLFAFFTLFFSVLFVLYFLPNLGTHIGFIGHMYRYSLTTENETFKTVIYMYQHLLLFFAFCAVILLFLLFAIFAYDMQARNEVIRELLRAKDDADASEKKGS